MDHASALRFLRSIAASSAEEKIGRPLTELERAGIFNIGSMMMLEAVEREFLFPATTKEQALKTLSYFANEAAK